MGVTQKEIAKRLNISQAHVGRALNGRTTGRSAVSEETRLRIEAAAREMGYNVDANREARALIAKRHGQRLKNGILAITFPQVKGPSPRTVPFFMPLLEGMETEAETLGLDLCLCLMRPDELPRMIRERGVDGVVSIGLSGAENHAIRDLELPLVVFNANYQKAHSVAPDDREGMRMVTRHLLELGHRDIAFLGVGSQRDKDGQGGFLEAEIFRLQGYKDALADYGIAIRDELIDMTLPLPSSAEPESCVQCGRCAACLGWQVLKEKSGVLKGGRLPFTAVVCHNDPVAMGLIRQAKNDGVSVPNDLSVTGFDDVSSQYYFQPSVTSISSSNYEMGRYVVSLLHQETMKGADTEEEAYLHRQFPVSLVVRQSTEQVPEEHAVLNN